MVGDWNLEASEVLATRLEDLTRGRLLGAGLPTAGTAAELDYALGHPRLASHLSLELAWDVPFQPHAALLCALPLKPLQELQPILRTITDSFDPILDSQRSLEPLVISPQRVILLEIEACDPLSLAFAQFSATAEAWVFPPVGGLVCRRFVSQRCRKPQMHISGLDIRILFGVSLLADCKLGARSVKFCTRARP